VKEEREEKCEENKTNFEFSGLSSTLELEVPRKFA